MARDAAETANIHSAKEYVDNGPGAKHDKLYQIVDSARRIRATANKDAGYSMRGKSEAQNISPATRNYTNKVFNSFRSRSDKGD